jgi:hypothetical protein
MNSSIEFTNPLILGVICIILIFFIVYSLQSQTIPICKLVPGFWESDSDFCKESGLDYFYIYIDDCPSTNSTSEAYLLAQKDGMIFINTDTQIKINYKYTKDHVIYFNIQFTDIDSEFFPQKQEMRFYPNVGKFVLKAEDTIYGVFYKNSRHTDLKFIVADRERQEKLNGKNPDEEFL